MLVVKLVHNRIGAGWGISPQVGNSGVWVIEPCHEWMYSTWDLSVNNA